MIKSYLIKNHKKIILFGMSLLSLFFIFQALSGIIILARPKPQETLNASRSIRAEAPVAADALFGKSAASLPAARSLKLKGIFTGLTPESGSAIIAQENVAPRLYVVGDALPSGAKLIAVYNTEVILETGEGEMRLALPENRF